MKGNISKKFFFTLRFGIIGTKESGKELFINFLKQYSTSSKINKDLKEFFLMHNQIPLKLKVFLVEDFNKLIKNSKREKKLDIIILALNLNELSAVQNYSKEVLDYFYKRISFQGISILAGLDLNLIKNGILSDAMRISRYNLISKTKELNFIYCYEIQDKSRDFLELFERIFNECIFKFQFSNPDLFERVLSYGKEITEKK